MRRRLRIWLKAVLTLGELWREGGPNAVAGASWQMACILRRPARDLIAMS